MKGKNSINYQRVNINTKRDRDGGRFRRNARHELKKKQKNLAQVFRSTLRYTAPLKLITKKYGCGGRWWWS